MTPLAEQVVAWFGFLGGLLAMLAISAWRDREMRREEHERQRRIVEELMRDEHDQDVSGR